MNILVSLSHSFTFYWNSWQAMGVTSATKSFQNATQCGKRMRKRDVWTCLIVRYPHIFDSFNFRLLFWPLREWSLRLNQPKICLSNISSSTAVSKEGQQRLSSETQRFLHFQGKKMGHSIFNITLDLMETNNLFLLKAR